MRREQFIFLIMIAALFFLAKSTFSYTSTQSFEQWKLFKDSRMNFTILALEPSDKLKGLSTETLKGTGTVSAEQVYNKYLLDAGRDLKTAAGLRYAGFGLGLAGLALSLYGDKSDLDLSRALQCGSVALLISPYYIGKAGKELAQAHLDNQIDKAGTALRKYRSSYYGGLATAVLGAGLLAAGLNNESDYQAAVGAAVALGGLLYSFFAPPHCLMSARSYIIDEMNIQPGKGSLLIHKIGGHLGDAGIYQYGSIFAYLLGGIITTYGVLQDDDTGIIGGSWVA